MINPIISTRTPTTRKRSGVRDPRARLLGAMPDMTLFTILVGREGSGVASNAGARIHSQTQHRVSRRMMYSRAWWTGI
eukprot:COSAG01_NODE_66970_length_268_cov_0.917160_1_plen_77_part_10